MVKHMVKTVYSIGYSGFSIEEFISALKAHNISLVVDVRSSPFSNYFPEYNKDSLEQTLRTNGIYYRNYAQEFGARQESKKFYCKEGYLDFDVFAQSDVFLCGLNKLCKSMEQNYTFALMCAEKDPINCHRTILVARAFFDRGYEVLHILSDGGTVSQEVINKRLIDLYFPNRDQMSLFGDIQEDAILLNSAYQKQNAEIGFRMEDLK